MLDRIDPKQSDNHNQDLEMDQFMIPEEVGYRSFLLRMWCVKQNHEISWRASLENPRTGEKLFFNTCEGLEEFLRQQREELENGLETKHV